MADIQQQLIHTNLDSLLKEADTTCQQRLSNKAMIFPVFSV